MPIIVTPIGPGNSNNQSPLLSLPSDVNAALTFDQNVAKTITLDVINLGTGVPSLLDPGAPNASLVSEFVLSQSPASTGIVVATGIRVSETVFSFALTETNLSTPGLLYAELRLRIGTATLQVLKYDVEVIPNLSNPGQFPLTIGEIRMLVRDRAPGDNNLLDQVEFEDSQIAAAIRWPIDEWNSKFGDFGATYSYNMFPYRWPWAQATVSELFKIAANGYQRNSLAYQAGGMTVSNQERAEEYRRSAAMYRQEWQLFMSRTRTQMSWDASMGSFGGHWMS